MQQLRDHGLSDPEIVDVVLAAAARGFFTKVLDALGVQADAQLGEAFDPEVRRQMTVGRPIADVVTDRPPYTARRARSRFPANLHASKGVVQ